MRKAEAAPVPPNSPTPVALFIFNRPQTTRRVLRAIAAARPARLFVIADGPRAERPDEPELCAQTRALVNQIDWPCEVLTNFSPTNLGCKQRIASGLDWLFTQANEAIILEDDCLPDPSFFPFCEELLDRHREDERVHMIAGCNLLNGKRFGPASYYFSRFYHIWGWATWARAWRHYDVSMSRWPSVRDTGWLETLLPTQAMIDRARYIFDETHNADRFTTWDYQWVFAGWMNNALCITPDRNLVTNLGFGAAATHTQAENSPLAALPVRPMTFPLVHPTTVEVNGEADLFEWNLLNPKTPAGSRWRRPHRRLASALRAFGRRIF